MSILAQWNEFAENNKSQEFWTGYFAAEQKNYETILENHEEVVSGTFSELSEKFEMEKTIFMGFLDGINTSLKQPLELENIDESSEIKLDIDYEKLYYNMLEAKAQWLYTLEQWDAILTADKRAEITKAYRAAHIAVSNKVAGRNDPCPCGSGKKYKKCCGVNE